MSDPHVKYVWSGCSGREPNTGIQAAEGSHSEDLAALCCEIHCRVCRLQEDVPWFGIARASSPFPVPVTTKWLLSVYSLDVLTTLEKIEARITSTFGSVLILDCTKKVSNTPLFKPKICCSCSMCKLHNHLNPIWVSGVPQGSILVFFCWRQSFCWK